MVGAGVVSVRGGVADGVSVVVVEPGAGIEVGRMGSLNTAGDGSAVAEPPATAVESGWEVPLSVPVTATVVAVAVGKTESTDGSLQAVAITAVRTRNTGMNCLANGVIITSTAPNALSGCDAASPKKAPLRRDYRPRHLAGEHVLERLVDLVQRPEF